jgi:hypothetical protein
MPLALHTSQVMGDDITDTRTIIAVLRLRRPLAAWRSWSSVARGDKRLWAAWGRQRNTRLRRAAAEAWLALWSHTNGRKLARSKAGASFHAVGRARAAAAFQEWLRLVAVACGRRADLLSFLKVGEECAVGWWGGGVVGLTVVGMVRL